MIKKYFYFFISLFIILWGCSTFRVNIMPSPGAKITTPYKTVAVFPLADYSFFQNFLREEYLWHISNNRKITEEITDNLTALGLKPCVHEDVVKVLKDEKIIKPLKLSLEEFFKTTIETEYTPGSLEYELNKPYLPELKAEILKIAKERRSQERKKVLKNILLEEQVEGLSVEKIKEVANKLGADLIIRGAIIEYGIKEARTLNPLQTGIILPFIDTLNNIIFGVSISNKYSEGLTDILTGGGLGYLIAKQSGEGTTGAGVGAALATISLVRKKNAESSLVQVRLYAQDASTAKVIWSGRAEVEYTPLNPLDLESHHYKNMFDKAIRKVVRILMNDLRKSLKNS